MGFIVYNYTPCPGSAGSAFTSNVEDEAAPAYAGLNIQFPNRFPGECYHVTIDGPDIEPILIDELIDWTTESFVFYDSCQECLGTATYAQMVSCCDPANIIYAVITGELDDTYTDGVYLYSGEDLQAPNAGCYTFTFLSELPPDTEPGLEVNVDDLTFRVVGSSERITCEDEICFALCQPCICSKARLILGLRLPSEDIVIQILNCSNELVPYTIPANLSYGEAVCAKYFPTSFEDYNFEITVVGDCISSPQTLDDICVIPEPCLCSDVTNTTENVETWRYIDCDDNLNSDLLLQPGETSPKVCVKEWLNLNGDIQFYGECLDGECPSFYLLTDCSDETNTFCSNSVSLDPYVDNNVAITFLPLPVLSPGGISFAGKCWTVTTIAECENPIAVTIDQVFLAGCLSCLSTPTVNYQLINCEDDSIIYTSTDLFEYIGQVVKLEGYGNECWFVNVFNAQAPSVEPVEISDFFDNCVNCTSSYFLLENCDPLSTDEPIITITDLSEHVGQIIILRDENNKPLPGCWQVSVIDSQNVDLDIVYGVYKCFETCEDCLPPIEEPCPTPPRSVYPNYTTGDCDPDIVEAAFCKNGENQYKKVLNKRFGIKDCCPENEDKLYINYEKIKLALLSSANPTPDPCSEDPIINEYYLFRGNNAPELILSYVDSFGVTQVFTIPECISDCSPVRFCAVRGTIFLDSVLTYASNESCDSNVVCINDENLVYVRPCILN